MCANQEMLFMAAAQSQAAEQQQHRCVVTMVHMHDVVPLLLLACLERRGEHGIPRFFFGIELMFMNLSYTDLWAGHCVLNRTLEHSMAVL
jgi:hypothetical protein